MSPQGNDRLGPLELGLYALCWAAALALASVHPPAQIGLALGAGALLLAGALGPFRGEGLRITPLAWVMLVAAAWTALQLAPMPPALLRLLSPHAAELRAEVAAGWAPITLDPAETTLALVRQLPCIVVVLLGAELLRTGAGVRRAAISLALLGGSIALVAIAHVAIGADKIYGWYSPRSHPGHGFFGPFVNRNHAAGLLSLCAMAALGVAAASNERGRLGYGLLATLIIGASLATASRGGAVGLAVAGLVLCVLLATARFGRTRGTLLSLAVVLVLGGAGAFLADGLRQRFTDHPNERSMFDNQKSRGWAAAVRLAGRYPLTGVGRGAFEAPIAETRISDEGTRLVYPESFVMQALSEWGYPFALGLLVAGALALGSAFRRCKRDPLVIGLLAAVIAILVHDLFDFSLEMPGIALPACLALAALAGRADADRRIRRGPRARLRWGAIGACAALVVAAAYAGIRAQAHTLAADVTPIRALIDKRDAGAARWIEAAIARHPASAELEILAGEAAVRRGDPSALHHLGRAMRLQPSAALAHHLAGIELARRGHRSQAALELRLAMARGESIDDDKLILLLGAGAIDAIGDSNVDLCRLGTALAARKRWEDAERAFVRAAELDASPTAQVARLQAMTAAPAQYRLQAAIAVERTAASPEALVAVMSTYAALGKPELAEATLQRGLVRFPASAILIVNGARQRAARGDTTGVRQLLERSRLFDRGGRILVEELRVELAEKAGELDAAAAARARLRIMRANVDLEEPAAHAR